MITEGKWILSTNCRIRDEHDNNIASCGGDASHFDWKISQANAHLIAAAPELLETCKKLVKMYYPGEDGQQYPGDYIKQAEQAIAKAEPN